MSQEQAPQRIKFTKSSLEPLVAGADPEKRITVWDSYLTGFGIRIGSSSSFFVQKKIDGRPVKVTLGKYGQLTPDQARKLALVRLGELSMGQNPNAAKRAARARNISLQVAFNDFLKARKSLKPRTIADYSRFLKVYFKDWARMNIASITRQMVQARHRKIGEKSGPAQANQAMIFLRSLINFALVEYEENGKGILPDNPVRILSRTRAWYPKKRRQVILREHEFPAFFAAIEKFRQKEPGAEGSDIADYVLFLLFTGLRRSEGATLQWENVDMIGKTFTIPETKNGESLSLPLSSFLFDMLTRRHESRVNEYVFPGRGKTGHLIEPKRLMDKVRAEAGVKITLHDLRRTFITVAESLDIPYFALKRLVNHKTGSDVTSGYIIHDPERLRGPMERITAKLLLLAAIDICA